ncbi:MAG: 6-pyruvoyl-tetrahydropterin synthase-related protein [Patescibacteria group bacterium]
MKIKSLILLSIFGLISVFALFNPGLPITHDGQDHVARIANFYQNLLEGNIIPRWAENLNWGYGHPILEFLYPLPSYIASLFHFLGFSLVDSVKIVFGLGMVLSLFFMYLWLSQFLSKQAAIFGSVLYTYAPYRFVELYVRGDIGEHLAFAFIPLVLFYVYRIYKKNNFLNAILGSSSLAFLILSHNAISLMFVPIIFLYVLYLLWQSDKKKLLVISYLLIVGLGLGLSAFFWIPGLLEGKYTLRNIVTAGGYIGRFVNFKDLLYGQWSYGGSGQFTVQFGIVNWFSLIISLALGFYFYQKKNKNLILILGLTLYTLIAFFLMLPISDFIWGRVILLQNFQFPWRFLAITVFTTSVLGAIVLDQIPRRYQVWSSILLIILILIFSKDYMKPRDYLYKPESFYTGIYNGTTDTGESAPIWSVRFMEKSPSANLEVIDGEAIVKEIERKTTLHKYKIDVKKNTLFRENTLYFPGWEIRANNKPVRIEFQNMTYRGIMLFSLPHGSYNVEVAYKETKLRLLADAISLISLSTVIVGIIFIFLIKLKHKKKL